MVQVLDPPPNGCLFLEGSLFGQRQPSIQGGVLLFRGETKSTFADLSVISPIITMLMVPSAGTSRDFDNCI